MLTYKSIFSSFSVNDLQKAKDFYTSVLGIEAEEQPKMGLRLRPTGGSEIFIYEKSDHQPATYTVLNFVVDDINAAVDELAGKGVAFEHYSEGLMKTDDKGIARAPAPFPDIAWFKDPAGNFLSIMQEK